VIFSYNRLALLLAVLAVLISYWVAENIYERVPHVEDEFAYLWQAQVFSRGQAYLASPPYWEQFIVPFVVDYEGLRFGKYPPGWPLVLSLGVLLGLTSWVNPLLAGLSLWFTFRLGQKIFDDRIAFLAAFLLITSPFFLINSGTLMSHPWSLMLGISFTLAWLDLFVIASTPKASNSVPDWLKTCVAGLSLGVLALTRPITAIGVGFPFILHGLMMLVKGNPHTRKKVIGIGILAGGTASILFVWQYILTGDPLQNMYALWWSYDGFGFGNDIGTQPGGHNLFWVINNLVLSMMAGGADLFGWDFITWLFVLAGLLSARRNRSVELLIGIPAGLILAYAFYWISPNLYGPRYYYESITPAVLLTSAGIFWLMNWFKEKKLPRFLFPVIPALITLLVGYNLTVYLPTRFDSMRNLYGINRNQLVPFLTDEAQSLTPALVIVHGNNWTDCAGLLPLQDPWLTTPFIFACYLEEPLEVIQQSDFPDRRIIHYYPGRMEISLEPEE
jgi:4-amino-4-deoxy-L-arabinose transferase-like glycosyltransferase